jgi:hypothetical protein
MMKLLDAIQQRVLGRVAHLPDLPPLTSYNETVNSDSLFLDAESHVRYRFEVRVGLEVTGPTKDASELRRRAARAIAHEVYGEVLTELRELRRELWQEQQYRAGNDPVLTRLAALEDKLSGL